ncbi:hypothetical protein Pcinc_006381 [Petrolisthes cinctipes]|uniref:C1q domain-containing protein n=1 Tax=Petrolisthes cinctipes TaxID=88211 RepID=A0AAE1GD60_PETCI|nr:hypothetical protein Pcinc_006381 [Petrolisthes cinctipes]
MSKISNCFHAYPLLPMTLPRLSRAKKMTRVVLAALVAVLGLQKVAGQDSQPSVIPDYDYSTHDHEPVTHFFEVAHEHVPAPAECSTTEFSVERAKPISGNNTIIPGKIEFLIVKDNDGTWSPIHNEFTAPCAGLFNFSFEAKSTEDFGIQLMKKGDVEVIVHGSYQQPVHLSITLNLKIGDRVYLYLEYGIIEETLDNETPNTHFNGQIHTPRQQLWHQRGTSLSNSSGSTLGT